MGHKAHPIGLRLGIHRKWKSNWFFDSKNYAKFIHLNLNIERFFRGYLYFYGIKTLLLNCQLIKLPSNQMFIFIFHYRLRKKHKKNLYKWKVKKWKFQLENYFSKRNLRKKHKNHYIKQSGNFYLRKYRDSLKDFYNHQILKSYLQIENFNLNFLKKKIKNFYKNFYWNMRIVKYIKNLIKNNKNSFSKYYRKICQIVLKKLFLKKKILLNKIKLVYLFTNLQFSLNINKLHLFKKIPVLYYKLYQEYNLTSIQTIFTESLSKKKIELNSSVKCLVYLNKIVSKIKRLFYFSIRIFGGKKKLFSRKTQKFKKKKYNRIFTKKNYFNSTIKVKEFLSKITNSKINLIFINSLSFAKFFYTIWDTSRKTLKKKKLRYNVLQIQKMMINKYKYSAIFIKDFVHLAFISVLLKNTKSLVMFMGEQFKRLPKNRKQFRLLKFLQQSLKIFCKQRKEFIGFKFQIKGRLNRRNRTHKWTFNQGILPIQTHKTRLEYGYSEGLTRSGLIGIKLWFFYKKTFKFQLKNKLLQYLHYSKHKVKINEAINIQISKFSWKKKTPFKKQSLTKNSYKLRFSRLYTKENHKQILKQELLKKNLSKKILLKSRILKTLPLNKTYLQEQNLKIKTLKQKLSITSKLIFKNTLLSKELDSNFVKDSENWDKTFPGLEKFEKIAPFLIENSQKMPKENIKFKSKFYKKKMKQNSPKTKIVPTLAYEDLKRKVLKTKIDLASKALIRPELQSNIAIQKLKPLNYTKRVPNIEISKPKPVGYKGIKPLGYQGPKPLGYQGPKPLGYQGPKPIGYQGSKPIITETPKPLGYLGPKPNIELLKPSVKVRGYQGFKPEGIITPSLKAKRHPRPLKKQVETKSPITNILTTIPEKSLEEDLSINKKKE